MGFQITSAPARIASFAGKEQAVRKANEDGAALPPRVVTFTLVLSMGGDEQDKALSAMFPGIDFVVRKMAGAEDDMTAQDVKRHKGLGALSCHLVDKLGGEVLRLVAVKTKGKPVARIAPKAERVDVPITFEASLTDDQFLAVARHYLGADLVATVGTAQVDIADVIARESAGDEGSDGEGDAAEKTSKKTSKKKNKDKESVAL